MYEKKPFASKTTLSATVVLFLVILFAVSYCPHDEWYEPTCTDPWVCVDCAATEGEPLGHDWEEATCVAPQTCSRCGETTGEVSPHTPGDWCIESTDYIGGTQNEIQVCDVCGETIDEATTSIGTLVSDGYFLPCADDIVDRFHAALEEVSGDTLYVTESKELDGSPCYGVMNYSDDGVAMLVFEGDGEMLSSGEEFDESAVGLVGMLVPRGASEEEIAYVMLSFVMACDPTLDRDEAGDVASDLLEGSARSGDVEFSGEVDDDIDGVVFFAQPR